MGKVVKTQSKRKSKAGYKASLACLMEEITRLEEKMDSRRVVIERLKVETQILKAESDIIAAQTQERLEALTAVVK